MRTNRWFLASVALAVALPALAQDRPESLLPPGFGEPVQNQPAAQPGNTVTTAPSRGPGTGASPADALGESETGLEVLSAEELPPPPPPIEYPDFARRDPYVVGRLDPVVIGLGPDPWGRSSGAFLSILMRRMDTPIASRWLHIALRNALLARTHAPANVNPVDWAGERAWLLLRMGEADAARMLVSGVDVDRFTPKMYQVAVQSALANADPSALCPLEAGIREVERRVSPLINAICSALSGEPESASAQVDDARRRGKVGGIDLVLAEKVVGAAGDSARAVTVEWEPVDRLTAWRFGLATATGLTPPSRLLKPASPQLRAWQARAPLLSPRDRLESARIAAALGVLSSQSLLDLYSAIYDSTDPDELSSTDAWQLRLAFAGKDLETRLSAMRKLWSGAGKDPFQREASRALLGRAASLVAPDPELQSDAPELIASMLAAGYDDEAARWVTAVRRMDDSYADSCWAMLALGAPRAEAVDLSFGRISAFIGRDDSPDKQRSALLVAGLAGLGRIDLATADRLNRRHALGIAGRTSWTRMIDRSGALGQPATVLVLAGTGFQGTAFDRLPSSHLYHSVAAIKRTGQDFYARMIAAEAVART
jgi:hypothetical protein